MLHVWLSIAVNMRRIIVIADDITGAAEIAGIALRHGLSVSMMIFGEDEGVGHCVCPLSVQCLVIATDSRSMDVKDAVETTQRVVGWVQRKWGEEAFPPQTLWFKKMDSALRGHVMEELEVMMAETGHQKAICLPANPSRGRTIKDGIYYIQGVPIDQTEFSFDPEFPAKTANVKQRFSMNPSLKVDIANASTIEDVGHAIQQTDDDTLLAGAADLFEAFLRRCESAFPPVIHPSSNVGGYADSPIQLHSSLLVCGSTQSKPEAMGLPVLAIPREVYNGEKDVNQWMDDYLETHPRPQSLALSFCNNSHRTSKDSAHYLRNVMAEAACRIINAYRPMELMIEGGATAFRLLRLLGWQSFTVRQEVVPGVVRMQADNDVLVILKPGSYHWSQQDITRTRFPQ